MPFKIIIKSILFFALFYGTTIAQYYEESNYSGVGVPFFEFSISRQFDSDFKNSQVVIIAQVINDDLTFIKSDTSGYDAELEWLIAVYNDDEKLIFSRTITEKMHVATFEKTNSRDERMTLKSNIPLSEGEYSILLRSVDLMTNKNAQRRVEIEIPEYYDEEIAISDILFLNSVILDSAGQLQDYEPILGNNFTLKSGQFYLYFNVFSKVLDVPAKIRYRFVDTKKKVEFDTLTSKMVKSNITSHILRIDKNRFTDNKFELKIDVSINGNEADISKKLTFFWQVVPNTASDINLALNQMVYVLHPDSLNYFLDADLDAKQQFFKRFWAERDPNPKTKKNELMDEYFKRINYANEHFSGLATDGWLTDRGRILIKFGFPDDVERHPFELETRPYVIWRYYSLRKLFLFEDYTGFGDFRLNPEYINVEYQ